MSAVCARDFVRRGFAAAAALNSPPVIHSLGARGKKRGTEDSDDSFGPTCAGSTHRATCRGRGRFEQRFTPQQSIRITNVSTVRQSHYRLECIRVTDRRLESNDHQRHTNQTKRVRLFFFFALLENSASSFALVLVLKTTTTTKQTNPTTTTS